MATLGAASKGVSNAQASAGFLIGNIYQATAAGTVTDLVMNIKGSTSSGDDQKFRPVIYNCSNSTTPSTLLAAGTEATVTSLGDVQTTFSISATLVLGNYYLIGIWSGPLATGVTFASPWYSTTGGSLGYFSAMTYASTGNPTSPYPTGGTHGTEDKVYGAMFVDYTPSYTVVGSGPTYQPTAADIGGTLYCEVTATNSFGSTSTASNTLGPVVGVAPVLLIMPVLTGIRVPGHVLSVTTGSWLNTPTSFTYQWQRDNTGGGTFSDIAGATSATYTLVTADLKCQVRCHVTATNATGSVTATSQNVVGPVGLPEIDLASAMLVLERRV